MNNSVAKLEKNLNFAHQIMKNMKRPLRIALFGNIYQPRKSATLVNLLNILQEHEAELLIDKAFYLHLTNEQHIAIGSAGVIEDDCFEADVAISMGGDGTFLEAARKVGNKNIPILGINMGRLGFLSDFSATEMRETIEQLYAGKLYAETCTVLQVEYSHGTPNGYPYALNEVAVLKRDNSSMISIRVEVNGEYLTTYQADGLIINTPTGSTGYALSVGGPIVSPCCGTLGIVPVAPHSLNMRPITIGDDREISLTVESRSGNFLVAIDGRSESCQQETRLTLRRAPYCTQVLKRSKASFFQALHTKLMWGNDVRGER